MNGRMFYVHGEFVTHEEIVRRAFPSALATAGATVSFRHAHPTRPVGHLLTGERVRINNGTIFSVGFSSIGT